MIETHKRGLFDKATGDLLKAGFVPGFDCDPDTQFTRDDVPEICIRRGQAGESQMTRWTEALGYHFVDQP